jgi:hypothetical protein
MVVRLCPYFSFFGWFCLQKGTVLIAISFKFIICSFIGLSQGIFLRKCLAAPKGPARPQKNLRADTNNKYQVSQSHINFNIFANRRKMPPLTPQEMNFYLIQRKNNLNYAFCHTELKYVGLLVYLSLF